MGVIYIYGGNSYIIIYIVATPFKTQEYKHEDLRLHVEKPAHGLPKLDAEILLRSKRRKYKFAFKEETKRYGDWT